jgi:hypothetical protein
MTASRREIVELWQRAQEALRATGTLLAAGFPDFAAARAYYAAFYAASALLLAEGKTFRSHRGAVALIHVGSHQGHCKGSFPDCWRKRNEISRFCVCLGWRLGANDIRGRTVVSRALYSTPSACFPRTYFLPHISRHSLLEPHIPWQSGPTPPLPLWGGRLARGLPPRLMATATANRASSCTGRPCRSKKVTRGIAVCIPSLLVSYGCCAQVGTHDPHLCDNSGLNVSTRGYTGCT